MCPPTQRNHCSQKGKLPGAYFFSNISASADADQIDTLKDEACEKPGNNWNLS